MTYHAFPIQLAKEAILLNRYDDALTVLKTITPSQQDPDITFLHAFLHPWDDDLSRIDAINMMIDAAEHGHSEANYMLAVCPELHFPYEFQLPPTLERFEYLQRAADLDSVAGVTDLAECYLKGRFVKQNDYHARKMLKRVYYRLDNQYPKTRYLYGKLLYEGRGGDIEMREGTIALMETLNYIDEYAIQALIEGKHLAREIDDAPTDDWWDKYMEKLDDKPTSMKLELWQSYFHHYCKHTYSFDLRRIDFDTFCDFIFDHFPIDRNNKELFKWKKEAQVQFNSYELIELYTTLLSDPRFLQKRYTDEQIYFGLDVIAIPVKWTVGRVMSDWTWTPPIQGIRAVYDMFIHLLSQPQFAEIGFMWWDPDSECSPIAYRNSQKHEQIRQTIFETQVRVLKTDNHDNQWAAIHGMGHWQHRDKDQALKEYLNNNPNLPKKLRDYALHAMGDTTHWL